jgi:hypothetical protein
LKDTTMTARLKSELWVQALLRRCSVHGKFGAVLHKGNAEAGAVMVVINHLNNTHTLLVPPPGPAYDEEGERRFSNRTATPQAWSEINALIARARRVDDDLWVVEIEDRDGFAGLQIEEL